MPTSTELLHLRTPRAIILGINLGTYGLYTLLFIASLYVLFTRRNAQFRYHLICTILIWVLITVAWIVDVVGDASTGWPQTVYEFLLISTHCLADFVLIRRCWLLWNKRYAIICFPAFLIFITGGLALFRVISYNLPNDSRFWVVDSYTLIAAYLVSLVTNLILTGLSAGRIWYISRQGQQVLGEVIKYRYQAVIRMIIESGVIYAACLVVVVILYPVIWKETSIAASTALSTLVPLSMQVSGIMPTMIIVRAVIQKREDTRIPISNIVFPSGWSNPTSSNTTASTQSVQAEQTKTIELEQLSNREKKPPEHNYASV